MSVQELQPTEFTERLSPIFEAILEETKYPAGFNPAYFYPHWRRLMELGVARTWAVEYRAVLGALFVPDTFSGKTQALCVFWFCLPEARGSGAGKALFHTFENAAKEKQCYAVLSAANVIMPAKRGIGYLEHGFFPVETSYRKVLTNE